jgi:hypothetical protein
MTSGAGDDGYGYEGEGGGGDMSATVDASLSRREVAQLELDKFRAEQERQEAAEEAAQNNIDSKRFKKLTKKAKNRSRSGKTAAAATATTKGKAPAKMKKKKRVRVKANLSVSLTDDDGRSGGGVGGGGVGSGMSGLGKKKSALSGRRRRRKSSSTGKGPGILFRSRRSGAGMAAAASSAASSSSSVPSSLKGVLSKRSLENVANSEWWVGRSGFGVNRCDDLSVAKAKHTEEELLRLGQEEGTLQALGKAAGKARKAKALALSVLKMEGVASHAASLAQRNSACVTKRVVAETKAMKKHRAASAATPTRGGGRGGAVAAADASSSSVSASVLGSSVETFSASWKAAASPKHINSKKKGKSKKKTKAAIASQVVGGAVVTPRTIDGRVAWGY